MKKIIFFSIAALLAGSSFAQFGQQEPNKNPLLNADFWEQKPSIEIVKKTIADGNSPTDKTRANSDVVYTAINNGASFEVVKYLIEQNHIDVNTAGHEKLSYVHAAASQGNAELLQYLITKGAKIDIETDFGMVPIVMAASRAQTNPEIYEAFFKKGTNPKATYANGANLLLLGISNDKDLKLATYLSTKGLSLNDTDNDGKTAFDYAVKSGDIELLKKLDTKGVKHTGNALLMATGGGGRRMGKPVSIDVFKYLVDDLKIDPAFKNKEGQNVLTFLVKQQNQSDIINYFLGKGLDINQADNEGNTVFMAAAGTKNVEILNTLLPKVKNINAVNVAGESALTSAVKGGSVETISLLLKGGADIHITDKEGNNLAYFAVQAHRAGRGGFSRPGATDDLADKLQLLKKNGLDVSAPQKNGSTLYHVAASKNDIVALKALYGLGININAKNADGMTALQKAALVAKNDEALKYILSLGADKTIKTDMDETAYDLAASNEYLKKNNISVEFLK
ncbi:MULTISPECIES: ankyrin repeat domain-containing protein [Chitinophagaceae]